MYYYSGLLQTLSVDELDEKLSTFNKSGDYGFFCLNIVLFI